MKAPVSAFLFSLGLALSAVAHAQNPPASANAETEMSEGVVRKIDRDAQKLTMRHGPIKNLDMPEMSMVFRVADPKMLERLKPEAKVRFKAERINGQLTVTHIEAAG